MSAPTITGWNGPAGAAEGWQPSFAGAAGQVRSSYQSSAGDGVVELFHAVYLGKPRRGHNLITFGNDLYDPARSHLLSSANHRIDLANGRHTSAGELRLSGAAGARLVWYWYCVDRSCTRSPGITKLLQAWDVLRGRASRSSVWALASPIANGGVDKARADLRAFAKALPLAGAPGSQAQRAADVAGRGP